MKKITTLSFLIISFSFLAFNVLRSNGYVGATQKNGGVGCNCHSSSPFSLVTAWVEGPDSLLAGTSGNYRLYMTGGPKVKGGFNLTGLRGKVYPFDGLTKLMYYVAGDSQLTHGSPLNFNNKDTIFWSFRYVAPSLIGADTIYSVVNSTNGNGMADGNDRWNFGQKFIVNVLSPVNVEDENLLVSDFILHQNYPNPFNPVTSIIWQVPVGSHQTLKVYDILGNEVATLIDEYRDAGKYRIDFDASELSSGIYIYKLTSDSFSASKKMLLIK